MVCSLFQRAPSHCVHARIGLDQRRAIGLLHLRLADINGLGQLGILPDELWLYRRIGVIHLRAVGRWRNEWRRLGQTETRRAWSIRRRTGVRARIRVVGRAVRAVYAVVEIRPVNRLAVDDGGSSLLVCVVRWRAVG